VETVKVIPYGKNTLVLFPHHPLSIHGVSIRSAATYPRRHVNLVGEFETNVYDLGRYPTVDDSRAEESASMGSSGPWVESLSG
jgi:hypothetical protein